MTVVDGGCLRAYSYVVVHPTSPTMHRTACTVDRHPTPETDAMLCAFGHVWGRVERWAFTQIHPLGRPLAEVKREAIRRFGITGRHFNGARFDIQQHVNARKGTIQFLIQDTKDRIEATEERIARELRKFATRPGLTLRQRLRIKGRIKGKRQYLETLRNRLRGYERDAAEKVPKVCFGGTELLRRGDVDAWRDRRTTRFVLVGSKGETCGNQSVHYDPDAKVLSILLPECLTDPTWHAGREPSKNRRVDKWLTFRDVSFRYGQDELVAAMRAGHAVTWTVFLDGGGRWHFHASHEEVLALPDILDVKAGVVALDLNVGCVAVSVVDRFGNCRERHVLPFPTAGTPEGVAAAWMGKVAALLVRLCLRHGFPLAREELDFCRKKAGLREVGKAHARRLSGWAYSRFFALLDARCARWGVKVYPVDPAYTSVIGVKKYAEGLMMTRHVAAALVIGRRAQGRGENLVTPTGIQLLSAASNEGSTVGRRWKKAKRLTRDGKPVRTARSAKGHRVEEGRKATPSRHGAHGENVRDTSEQVGNAVTRPCTTHAKHA